MFKKIFSYVNKTNLSTLDSYSKGSTFSLLLVLLISAVSPVAAKDVAKDLTKDATKDTAKDAAKDAAKSVAPKKEDQAGPANSSATPAVKGPRGASFVDPPVGAKSTADLVKKLSEAYYRKDDVSYLSLVKAPIRTRIRMHQQFMRECHRPTSDFKYETVAEEAARLNTTKDALTKRMPASGGGEGYEVPVVGFITYDSHNALSRFGAKILNAPAWPCAKLKDTYFIITKQSADAATPTATAQPASSAPAKAH